ncbi:MAG TPA: inositol monophosphatase [Planctomycetaceae bacterium]|nr:inositol monophosphatase [Planctomycetaceae bacterium]
MESVVQSVVETASEAARRGGSVLRDKFGRVDVQEKAPSDLVTDADFASQAAIEELLTSRFPSYAFLGEESTEADRESALASGRPLWVVDPLDGTANFVHRLLSFSVSIALVEDGVPTLGVVYDPMLDVLYVGDSDGRVTKNNKPIRNSGCKDLSKAMTCCSFRPGVTRQDTEVGQFLCVLERSQSMRRLGSAALNLCYLAEGCLDSYWATSVKAWDVAAGFRIASNAGVQFTSLDRSEFDVWNPRFVASSTPELQSSMLECLDPS